MGLDEALEAVAATLNLLTEQDQAAAAAAGASNTAAAAGYPQIEGLYLSPVASAKRAAAQRAALKLADGGPPSFMGDGFGATPDGVVAHIMMSPRHAPVPAVLPASTPPGWGGMAGFDDQQLQQHPWAQREGAVLPGIM